MHIFKKIARILMVVVLLVATSGVTLNKHYCFGRLKSVAVFQPAENCIGGDMEESMPCCEDVSEHLKVKELSQTNFDFDAQPHLIELAAITWITFQKTWIPEAKSHTFWDNGSPPTDTDFQVEHQVFLI